MENSPDLILPNGLIRGIFSQCDNARFSPRTNPYLIMKSEKTQKLRREASMNSSSPSENMTTPKIQRRTLKRKAVGVPSSLIRRFRSDLPAALDDGDFPLFKLDFEENPLNLLSSLEVLDDTKPNEQELEINKYQIRDSKGILWTRINDLNLELYLLKKNKTDDQIENLCLHFCFDFPDDPSLSIFNIYGDLLMTGLMPRYRNLKRLMVLLSRNDRGIKRSFRFCEDQGELGQENRFLEMLGRSLLHFNNLLSLQIQSDFIFLDSQYIKNMLENVDITAQNLTRLIIILPENRLSHMQCGSILSLLRRKSSLDELEIEMKTDLQVLFQFSNEFQETLYSQISAFRVKFTLDAMSSYEIRKENGENQSLQWIIGMHINPELLISYKFNNKFQREVTLFKMVFIDECGPLWPDINYHNCLGIDFLYATKELHLKHPFHSRKNFEPMLKAIRFLPKLNTFSLGCDGVERFSGTRGKELEPSLALSNFFEYAGPSLLSLSLNILEHKSNLSYLRLCEHLIELSIDYSGDFYSTSEIQISMQNLRVLRNLRRLSLSFDNNINVGWNTMFPFFDVFRELKTLKHLKINLDSTQITDEFCLQLARELYYAYNLLSLSLLLEKTKVETGFLETMETAPNLTRIEIVYDRPITNEMHEKLRRSIPYMKNLTDFSLLHNCKYGTCRNSLSACYFDIWNLGKRRSQPIKRKRTVLIAKTLNERFKLGWRDSALRFLLIEYFFD